MNRRDFFLYSAASAGALLPARSPFAKPCAPSLVTASDDSHRSPAASEAILEESFRGVDVTMPDGSKKLYPDADTWAFTFWPGTKWPDSYGDGTSWLGANAECQTYVTPFISSVNGTPLPVNLRYDPFSIQHDGLHIKASLLSPEQQAAYKIGGFRRFGSGMLLSRTSFTFGNIRMVAKLPSARGSWADLWLLPQSHQWPPEIDIFEAMPWGKHQQQIHYGVLVPKGANGQFGNWIDLGVDPSAGFHEYGLNWTSETLTGLFDGRVLWQQPTPASLQQHMYLIINYAVGGKWPFNELNIQPIDSIAADRLSSGADLIQADYPAEMIVKSIKVTSAKC
jgi:beta-glucanase (GH16 family)